MEVTESATRKEIPSAFGDSASCRGQVGAAVPAPSPSCRCVCHEQSFPSLHGQGPRVLDLLQRESVGGKRPLQGPVAVILCHLRGSLLPFRGALSAHTAAPLWLHLVPRDGGGPSEEENALGPGPESLLPINL